MLTYRRCAFQVPKLGPVRVVRGEVVFLFLQDSASLDSYLSFKSLHFSPVLSRDLGEVTIHGRHLAPDRLTPDFDASKGPFSLPTS